MLLVVTPKVTGFIQAKPDQPDYIELHHHKSLSQV